MPQNIVLGRQAIDVAEFVATYSGHKAPKIPGVVQCNQVPIGTIAEALAPSGTSTTATGPSSQSLVTQSGAGNSGAKSSNGK
jgi:hypothetical protein